MKQWFFAIVALQLVFVAGEAVKYQRQVSTGQTVLLKVVPVDPRSLFTGHYMALDYDISSIPVDRYPALQGLKYNDTIYVGMRPAQPFARLETVERFLPLDRDGLVYLRGRVAWPTQGGMRINYGLDRYYIPETKQDEVNALWQRTWERKAEVAVETSVGQDGTPFIKRVIVDGTPLSY